MTQEHTYQEKLDRAEKSWDKLQVRLKYMREALDQISSKDPDEQSWEDEQSLVKISNALMRVHNTLY